MEKSKSTWVMYERLEIEQGNKYEFQNYQSNCWAFSDFETAKKAMRNRIVELATSNNALFPESGEIYVFNDYLDSYVETFCDDPDFADSIKGIQECHNILHKFLTDCNFPNTIKDLSTCLELFPIKAIESYKEEGWFDGGGFGFGMTDADEPELICQWLHTVGVGIYIYINCFIMGNSDKKYSFHISNGLAEEDYYSSVFLELEKVDY